MVILSAAQNLDSSLGFTSFRMTIKYCLFK
jgi:hypothetical protein